MRTMNTFAPAYRMPLVGRRRGISIPLMLIATVCGLLLWPNFEFGLVQLKNAKYRGSARVAIPPQCRGKERVLEILNKAMKFAVDRKCHPSVTSLLTRSKRNRSLAGKGKQNHVYGMTTCNVHDICHQLPQWKQIQHLYGDKPAVLGIETCAKYRENLMLHNNNDQNATPAVRIAGLYNSGTNVLERSFADNLHQFRTKADPTDESSSWDVPWGKHIPPSTTQDQHSKTVDIMPVVVVRDPFRWMASMCKTSYDVSWMRAPHRHCPNLVPIEEDWDTPLRKKPKKIMSTYKVRVLNEQIDQYDSLADLWTVFYKTYMEADFPRLLVRFEDLLFHRENVMAQIVECVTGESAFSSLSSATATTPTDGKSRTHKSTGSWFHEEPLKYRLSPVKEHGRSSDLVSAVIKYGTSRGRYAGMASEDLRYAAKALDPKLLRKFQYLAVPVV